MARVFVSYSHQDEDWKSRVVKQLGVLATEGLEVWDDRKIAAGAAWSNEIASAIATCDVAVLLISADFLTSRFILGQEVPALLQRRQQQGIRVVPLILKPCTWTRIPWLGAIQARPKDGKPLSGMNKHDAEAALAALAGEIADFLLPSPSKMSAIVPPRPPGSPPPPALAIWQEKLDFLRQQEAICSDPAQKFTLKKQIEALEAQVGPSDGNDQTSNTLRIDLTHLPAGAPHFLGREAELARARELIAERGYNRRLPELEDAEAAAVTWNAAAVRQTNA